jgi:hypothetical protein
MQCLSKVKILLSILTSRARRPGLEQRRINVDFPTWMVDALDREASRLGVTHQSIIKIWIADRLRQEQAILAGYNR